MKFCITEILNIPNLQGLLDSFHKVSGIPSAIIDLEGNILTKSGWQDICTKFHRINAETERQCVACDVTIAKEVTESNGHVEITCPRRLIDTATPLVIEGEHIANVFLGQFFLDEPDIVFFRNQAKEFGFDEKRYLEAVNKVPVLSRKELDANLSFIADLTESLAIQGLKQLENLGIKRAYQELSQRLSYHANNSPLAVIEWGPDMKLIRWSGEAEQIFGWKAEEVLGKKIEDFRWVYEEDVKQVAAVSNELESGKNPRRFSINRNYKKDGSVVVCEWYNSSMLNDAGQIQSILSLVLDVTERTEANNRLNTIMREQQIVLDNAPVGIFLTIDRKKVWVNRKTVELFQYTKEEMEGQTSRILYPSQEAYDQIGKDAYPILAQGQVFETTQELRRRDGSQIWVRYIARAIDPADMSKGSIWIMEDISERIKFEHELEKAHKDLKERKTLLKLILDTSSVGIFLVDMEGHINHANRRMSEMFGWSLEELARKEYVDLIHPSEREIGRQNLLALLASQIPSVDLERLYWRADNSEFWGRLTAKRFYNASGQEHGLVGVISDISERKQSEIEIQRLASLLHESQHIARIGGWEIDLVLNTLFWTDETFHIHDTTRSEFTPTLDSAIGFYAPDSMSTIRSAINSAIEEGKNFNLELELITARQRRIWVYVTSRVIQEHGKTIKINGVIQDITERRNLEEKLRQSLKMESIGRLAGGIAHDFNNKLSIILGYAELLKLRFPDNQHLQEHLNEISKAAEHSRDITNQLLSYSRRQIISPQTINFNAAIEETNRTLPRLIGEDIVLRFDLDSNLWGAKIDPTQFDQIIMNLAVNARDAMPEGGLLTIGTSNTLIDETFCREHVDAVQGEYVQLSISDNGHGMDLETRNHIFEPFFTTKNLGKGTGLGLATIHGIVAQNNGFIVVDSVVGQGTKFRLFFPRCEYNIATETKDVNKIVMMEGNVLLVEDDENLRIMTTMLLEHIGYTVMTANNPIDAINISSNLDINLDIVITDVILPEMNGREMIDAIEMMRPNVRVLYISGYTSEIISTKGVIAENINFLQKPFDLNGLNNKIKEILES